MSPNRSRLAALAVLAGLALPAPAADEAPPADLPGLLRWADEHNAELRALRFESEAADSRIVPAGALADPMFQIELRDIPRQNVNVLPARVGSTKYTISQALPWWGKRELRRQVAEAEAGGVRARLAERRAELHARLKTAYAQHYSARQATAINLSVQGIARDLERVAHGRYSNGLAPQQDVVKAQLEQTSLRAEAIRLAAEARQAQARLNAVLGRPAEAALAEPASLGQMPEAPLAADDVAARAGIANPSLRAAQAQMTAAEHGRRLARRNWYPDFNLALSPVQRGDRLDAWEAMVGINLPLQADTRRAQEREAQAMLQAAQARREDALSRLSGDLGEQVAGFNAALEQEQLLRDTLLPQAQLALRAALAGYESGKVDFATLLDAQRQIREARLAVLRAQVEQRQRLAEVERLIGEE